MSVDDTAYDATAWDGVTSVAPSKNAVRDKLAGIDAQLAAASNNAVAVRNLSAGSSDNGPAINDAIAALPAGGGAISIPAGTWNITTPLVIPSNVAIYGAGRATVLRYTGSGRFIDLTSKMFITLQNLRLSTPTTTSAVTLLYLDGTFRCSFIGVCIDGTNVSGGLAPYTQRGVELRGNAGDNRFINCDINNMGTGVATSCIMNYLLGCVLGSNRRGVHGDLGSYGAGISIDSCTFVSNADITDYHISIDVEANKWWITNSWFEGSAVGIIVGQNTTGGPGQFGIANCTISATTAALIINVCKQAYLANLNMGKDVDATPTTLTFPYPLSASEGTAVNLITYNAFDYPASAFPPNWTYIGRGTIKVPSVVYGPLTGKVDYRHALKIYGSDATTVPIKSDSPSNTSVNLIEIGKGGNVGFSVDQYSNVVAGGVLANDKLRAGATASIGWNTRTSMWSGSGAPTIAGTRGDIYFRTDTPATANQRIYICSVAGAAGAATWLGIL